MAQRATDAGHPISHVQIGEYAKAPRPVPSEATRRALAAALGVSVAEVTRAAVQSVEPGLPEGWNGEYALAFLRLTEGRTDEEIRQTLGVVEATLRAMAASREAASEPPGPDRDELGTRGA